MPTPIVAIVGRPNVGKSTLFNRVLRERLAITADEPGTTRDRLFGRVEWLDRTFTLADTAGIEDEHSDMQTAIQRQVKTAVRDADAIVFLTDVETGLTSGDAEVADTLRRSLKPVLLVVNKVDNDNRALNTPEFFKLGLGEPLPISAHHNLGVADLLDRVVGLLPTAEVEPEAVGLRVAIIGRPNTGKSSLTNALAGEERVVVSAVPGTTRDSIDTVIKYKGNALTLIDTAGLRRRGKIETGVENFSSMRTLRAIERANVALLVLDASEIGASQDLHVAGYALEAHKGLILVVNKWDLAEDLGFTEEQVTGYIRRRFKFVPHAPIVFVSSLKVEGLGKLLKAATDVYTQRMLRISTGDLNRVIGKAAGLQLPRLKGQRRLNLLYTTQVAVDPPTFVFFVNDPDLVHFSYQRDLENKLREMFGFEGTPIRMLFRARGERQAS